MAIPEVQVEPLGEGWNKYSMTQEVQACRTGWRGAWDAFVAAITRNPRRTIAQPATLTITVKNRPGLITDIQLEIKQ